MPMTPPAWSMGCSTRSAKPSSPARATDRGKGAVASADRYGRTLASSGRARPGERAEDRLHESLVLAIGRGATGLYRKCLAILQGVDGTVLHALVLVEIDREDRPILHRSQAERRLGQMRRDIVICRLGAEIVGELRRAEHRRHQRLALPRPDLRQQIAAQVIALNLVLDEPVHAGVAGAHAEGKGKRGDQRHKATGSGTRRHGFDFPDSTLI